MHRYQTLGVCLNFWIELNAFAYTRARAVSNRGSKFFFLFRFSLPPDFSRNILVEKSIALHSNSIRRGTGSVIESFDQTFSGFSFRSFSSKIPNNSTWSDKIAFTRFQSSNQKEKGKEKFQLG